MSDLALSADNSQPPLQVTIHPKSKKAPTTTSDPWTDAGFTEKPPRATTSAPTQTTSTGEDPWKAAGFSETPPEKSPAPQIGAGDAALHGGLDAATFGTFPTLVGVAQAGGADKAAQQKFEEAAANQPPGPPAEGAQFDTAGLAQTLHDVYGNHPDPEVRASYDRGRQKALEEQNAAREQNPKAYFAGQIVGSALTPSFGAGAAGTTGARIGTGMLAGGIGAGLYGAGEAVSEGKNLPEAVESGAKSVPFGAVTGGVLKGALGPRIAAPASSSGQRAADFAANVLEAPLPKGLASDNRSVQNTTALLQSVPFVGSRITGKVEKTAQAAGEHIGDIASQMTGGTQGRATADVLVRPGLQQIIKQNHTDIDRNYDAVRSMIDQNARFTMPRTDAALNEIMRRRAGAGKTNPALGLEQFRNVAGGATFEGAHEARVDARAAGNPTAQHPGYQAGHYNRLTAAMGADIREIVRAAAIKNGQNPQRALAAFDKAEKEFGRLSEQNDRLDAILHSKGQAAIETFLGAAKEKGGDIKLLAQLKQSMSPQEFEQVGGTLLNELGYNKAIDEFSLAKFVTNWNDISDRAKALLFQPKHLHDIEETANLGKHVKAALRQSNTSHTGSFIMLLDIAKDAALLGADFASGGGIGVNTMIGAGSTTILGGIGFWLGNSAKASSMAAWTRAYNAAAQRSTPARIAAFKVATRNMANTLGLDPAKVTHHIEGTIAGKADTSEPQPGPKGDKQQQRSPPSRHDQPHDNTVH